jgi:hypothetical protein
LGGFSIRAEAQRALQNKLARLVPGGRSATMTLGEWVEEYLDTHQGERITVAKLRWLLGKATAKLGEVRLAELSPEQVCAWRLTVPEGHRFEATQALRQVLRTYPITRNHDRLSSALRGPAEVELRSRRTESEGIAKRAREPVGVRVRVDLVSSVVGLS